MIVSWLANEQLSRAGNVRPPVWLWQRLRGARIDGHRFRRQHPIGRYFADFACDQLRLILEIDGGVHARDDVVLRDHLRQVELESFGWTVLRFSNEEALAQPDRIIAAIRHHARGLRVQF